MRRAVVIAVCVQAWTGCVALPEEESGAPLADASVDGELALDGGSRRPAVGQPYRGPQCTTNEPGGGGGGAPQADGGWAVEPPGDGDGDGDGDTGGGGGGEPMPVDDGGTPMMPPGQPRPERAGDVVITEIMFDPKGRPDTDGEWIELWSGQETEALSLDGCVLDDGASTPRKLEALLLEPGAYATIGRGADAGFVPDLVAALTLTNGSDTVALLCDGVEIDRVTYDGTFPLRSGASLSLDPARMTPLENDDPASWCPGTADYGGDLGTPGLPNPSCTPDDAGAL